MASNGVILNIRPDVIADPTAAEHHEGLMSHAVVQLGLLLNTQAKAFDETVILTHGLLPPAWNLAVESPLAPAWCPALVITPMGSPVPPPPGLLPLVFTPGLPPVVGAAPPMTTATPLTTPTVVPFSPPLAEAQIAAMAATPGGFAAWSLPGNVHTLKVTGTVPVGVAQGVYRHNFYVTAALDHTGAGRAKIAKISLAILVQEATA